MSLDKHNHIDLLFPSKYLKGADLRGRDVTVVIAKIDPKHKLRRDDGSTESKPAVYLRTPQGRPIEKMWVLNKTNALTISGMYGPRPMDWIGKPVTLRAERVRAFGSMHDAIRVRSSTNAAADSLTDDLEAPTMDDLMAATAPPKGWRESGQEDPEPADDDDLTEMLGTEPIQESKADEIKAKLGTADAPEWEGVGE